MMDYNLGEKYSDRFVSVNNEPIYDFDEFSYFGKDALWEPQSEEDLYSRLQDALNWARNVQQSTGDQSDIEEPIDSDQPSSNTQEAPPESPSTPTYVQTNKPKYVSQIGNFNVDKAIDRLHYLTAFKLDDRYDTSQWTRKNPNRTGHWCSRAVTLALEAGGLQFTRDNHAGNMGPHLLKSGWVYLPDDTTNFQKGDICVIKGLGAKGHGHICMYDGKQWVSDFYQRSWDVYHGQAKRGKNTKFYRYKG